MTRGNATAFLWASDVASGTVAGVTTAIGPMPADFISHLEKFDQLEVGAPVPVMIDGLAGTQFDVVTTAEALEIFRFPEDAFNVAAGERLRFYLVEVGGDTVILIMDAFEQADFDTFLTEVGQPLLDELRWG